MTTQTNPTKLTKADLIKLVAELRAENEVLRDAELRLRARNAELRDQVAESADEIAALRAEIEELRDDSVAVGMYVQELRAEIKDLRAEPQPQPAPQQPAPQPQPQRRQPRDLSALRAAAMAYRTTSKFDEHGNVLVLVNGAWRLA